MRWPFFRTYENMSCACIYINSSIWEIRSFLRNTLLPLMIIYVCQKFEQSREKSVRGDERFHYRRFAWLLHGVFILCHVRACCLRRLAPSLQAHTCNINYIKTPYLEKLERDVRNLSPTEQILTVCRRVARHKR